MNKTKLITINMKPSQEKVLKMRAISKGLTKSRMYRNIISDYMNKENFINK
jgi:hypothetical protein